jgi:hypothetical protein
MPVISCKISLPVTLGEEKQNKQKTDITLSNLRPVSVHRNKILDAIMSEQERWETSPIIWVDNIPYKIKLLKASNQKVCLLQMPMQFHYKRNGKESYSIIGKRTVEITLA